jgi:hypothetical protein
MATKKFLELQEFSDQELINELQETEVRPCDQGARKSHLLKRNTA